MKTLRLLLLPLALPLLLLACSPHARAQSPAQKSFAEIKSLAGDLGSACIARNEQ